MAGILRRWVTGVASVALAVLTFRRKRADAASLRKMEFSSSGQKMGVRFTERIRDRWRRRWLKVHR